MNGKSGRQVATENVAKLIAYLEAHKGQLPVFPDGTLNKSAIARAAGLDRQIFTTNPEAKKVLAQYGTPSSRPHLAPTGEESERRRQLDAENSRLRDMLAKRELELSKLRKEVQDLRLQKAMHDAMIETMRHIKPLPHNDS